VFEEAKRFLFMDKLMDQIKKEEWTKWAEMVRSEQIPADELQKLFEENPKFSQWYFTSYSIPR